MITVNCGWVRKAGRKWEHKNTVGIRIDLPKEVWEGDHATIREAIYKHRPEGDGWSLTGYALVEGKGI